MSRAEIQIIRVDRYTDELASAIGDLTVHLTERAAIDCERLEFSISSPSVEQFVAVMGERVVGASTLTELGGLLAGPRNAWLSDVVTHPEARGTGTADQMADEWEDWSREREIGALLFTSGWNREAAHRFYRKRGAYIINEHTDDKTAFWNYPIPVVG